MAQTPKDLEEQLALRRERLRQIVGDIRAVLQEDIPTFVNRETKATFLANPKVAFEMSADQVKALKTRAGEVGPAAAKRIVGELEDEARWLSADSTTDPRSLEAATDAWSVIRTAEDDLAALLQEFGLETDPTPRYKAPMYFVGGRYLPSLSENFWKTIAERNELEEELREVEREQQRDALVAKWDEA